MTMTETMFNALMEYLEVRSKEDRAWYREQFERDGVLTLMIFNDGQVIENWDSLTADEPDNIDDDCGFDPFMGSFTYDV